MIFELSIFENQCLKSIKIAVKRSVGILADGVWGHLVPVVLVPFP